MPAHSRLDVIQKVLFEGHYPSYRYGQIVKAIYQDGITRYSDITVLPQILREQLVKELGNDILTLKKIAEVKGKQAHKILFETQTGQRIETVRLTYQGPHYSLCLSTQSGCGLGCRFCATGAVGFKKNLSADEITDQLLYFIQEKLPIDSLIFMGMGEPFNNQDNVFNSLHLLTDQQFFNLSDRRISVSTVGLVPGMNCLTSEYPNINLAVSLHSPDQDERARLMPIAQTYSITDIFASLDQHLRTTNHKVFLAYVLLKGTNDSPKHAMALANIIKANSLRQKLCHVNLIRYNPSKSLDSFEASPSSSIEAFQAILDRENIHNTLRQDFGTDIAAACGQLYAQYLN